jgi:hypothetical protein
MGRKIVHGDASHYKKRPRIYNVWNGIRYRCENPASEKYKNYGGRGIKVCPEWHDYETFKSWALAHGYCENLQIDRKDNDKDYCPDNCVFVTNRANNGHRTNTIMLTVNGDVQCVEEWTRRIKMSKNRVRRWLKWYGKEETERRIAGRLSCSLL